MGRYTAEKGPLEAMQMAQRLRVPLDLYGDTELVASQEYVDRCRNEADGLLVRYNQGVTRTETVELYQRYKALLYLPNWDEPHGAGAGRSPALRAAGHHPQQGVDARGGQSRGERVCLRYCGRG